MEPWAVNSKFLLVQEVITRFILETNSWKKQKFIAWD